MQEHETDSGAGRASGIYDFGVEELRRVSVEDAERHRVESTLTEARGREAARLHVTLKALDESEKRTLHGIARLTMELEERTTALRHLVENFEAASGKHLDDVHGQLKERVTELQHAVTQQVQDVRGTLAATHRAHFESLEKQIVGTEGAVMGDLAARTRALTEQLTRSHDALAAQGHEATVRLSREVDEARDEVIRLLDARLNQVDASFAAVRGDLEVVKHLVMDVIKSRVGRTDPNPRAY